MNFDPNFLAAARSDEELMERVDNREKYMPETIEASLAELQRRGKEFSDEELRYIHEDIQARRTNAESISGMVGIFNSEYKNVIVEDPDAPLMFSTRAIYLFTFLTSPLFGSIMMALNLSKLGKGNAVAGVVLFGFGFTFLGAILAGNMGPAQILVGLAGAYCLNYLFWRPFIGFSTYYRARPIWVPLIIALILISMVILAVIYSPEYRKLYMK